VAVYIKATRRRIPSSTGKILNKCQLGLIDC
jgi:hypothetical protein